MAVNIVSLCFRPIMMLNSSVRSTVARMPRAGLTNLARCLLNPSASGFKGNDRALHGRDVDTVYDNIEGGPKVRGIDLLRDPFLNKVSIDYVRLFFRLL